MGFHTHVLGNGLQIIGETIPTARSACVGFFVRTGARDETAEVSGVSHFLEHMVFKGTPRRTALDVNLEFDRIGASYNAYTSEESTVYYAAVLPEYLPQAIDILADVLRPSLRDEDFNTEKQVILEEIGMYEDMPAFAASDHARKIYFQTHPLGNSILGTSASVSALSRDQMQSYFDCRYVAPNIVVAVAGVFDWPAFVDMVQRACAHWPQRACTREHLIQAGGAGGVHAICKEGTLQEHVLAISPGPSAEDPMRYSAATLALALGDDSGSRFYWELIDPGNVESASCSVDQNQANGVLASSYSCDPDRAAKNLQILHKVLGQVQKDGITETELFQAKSKILSRMVRHSERPMGRMRAIAASWIYNQEYHDIDTELARFDQVTRMTIGACLERYPVAHPTVIGYGPVDKLD